MPSKQVNCTACGQSVAARGLATHNRNKHGVSHPTEALVNIEREVQLRLVAERAKSTAEMPSVSDYIQHCENGACSYHAADWEKAKLQIVKTAYENMPSQLLLDLAKRAGFIPNRIVIRSYD